MIAFWIFLCRVTLYVRCLGVRCEVGIQFRFPPHMDNALPQGVSGNPFASLHMPRHVATCHISTFLESGPRLSSQSLGRSPRAGMAFGYSSLLTRHSLPLTTPQP